MNPAQHRWLIADFLCQHLERLVPSHELVAGEVDGPGPPLAELPQDLVVSQARKLLARITDAGANEALLLVCRAVAGRVSGRSSRSSERAERSVARKPSEEMPAT